VAGSGILRRRAACREDRRVLEDLDALEELAALRGTLDRIESLLIARARREGWTWSEIGAAHGTNRQIVRRRAPPELRGTRPARPSSPLDGWTKPLP
jgi:hypothetical protein